MDIPSEHSTDAHSTLHVPIQASLLQSLFFIYCFLFNWDIQVCTLKIPMPLSALSKGPAHGLAHSISLGGLCPVLSPHHLPLANPTPPSQFTSILAKKLLLIFSFWCDPSHRPSGWFLSSEVWGNVLSSRLDFLCRKGASSHSRLHCLITTCSTHEIFI